MFDKLFLNIIMFVHFIVVCLVIGVPFFGNNYLLFMHSICVPFMMLHWIINDNTCVLSIMEIELRKKLDLPIKKKDCFTCQLIEPIYDFKANNEKWTWYIYIATISLWLITMYKLCSMYQRGEIVSMNDFLFKNNTTKLFY